MVRMIRRLVRFGRGRRGGLVLAVVVMLGECGLGRQRSKRGRRQKCGFQRHSP
jgi:hypothetical protein